MITPVNGETTDREPIDGYLVFQGGLPEMEDYFKQLVTEDNALYRHSSEGVDDMPAHIKSSITDVSLSIPVSQGRLALGTWQGIFLFEHRHHAHTRRLALHILGD